MNCVTSFDAMAWGSIGLVTAATSSVRRVFDSLAGMTTSQRRARDWDANAEFMAGLGHDPVAVLGARPADRRTPDPASVPDGDAAPSPALARRLEGDLVLAGSGR